MSTYSRGALLAAAVAAAALVTACGSAQSSQPATAPSPSASQPATPVVPAAPSSPAASPVTTASSSASSAPAPPAPSAPAAGSTGGAALATCQTSSLRISIDDSQANGAAGSAYYPLNFINTSATACEMYGFPGVSFAAAGSSVGKQIGQAATRSGAFPKIAVRLAPGGTAHAWVKVAVAANYPASQCQPVTVGWLRVYPPGETVAGYVGHAFTACSAGGVTQLTVLPVREGLGLAAVTP
jgi:hypothetical protein